MRNPRRLCPKCLSSLQFRKKIFEKSGWFVEVQQLELTNIQSQISVIVKAVN